MKSKSYELQKKINYEFQDVKLLKEALTHSSYSNEYKKIKEQKDKVSESEYIKNQSDDKLRAKGVELTEWESKAKTEKEKALQTIDNEINRLSNEKIKGEEKVEIVKQNIDKQLKVKQKEKETKKK